MKVRGVQVDSSSFSVQLARTVLSAVVGLVVAKCFERGFDAAIEKAEAENTPSEE